MGSCEAKCNDWTLYIQSGLEIHLRAINLNVPVENRLYLYRDIAYMLSYGIIGGYKASVGVPLSPLLKTMNTYMSGMCISIEHGFGKFSSLWSFISFKHNLKLGKSPVGSYFMMAVLFCNIHSCIYGNQTSKRFRYKTPTL